jgi:hypothetical protein
MNFLKSFTSSPASNLTFVTFAATPLS